MVTVRDWAQRHGASYRVVISAGPGRTFRCNFGLPALLEPVVVEQPEVYVAEIPDATIAGSYESIWATGEELNDLAVRHEGRLPVQVWPMLLPANPADVIEAGILLAQQFSTNYFHWLVEQLTRLQLVDVNLPLLVDRLALGGQLGQALHALTGLSVIDLAPGRVYRVKRLTVLGRLAWIPPDLRPGVSLQMGDFLMAPEAVSFLRASHVPGQRRKRLFVERRNSPRLINRDEVRQMFEGLGYETIHPEDLTFFDQRALFGTAAVVAGESGGGLTNIVFAPSECILVCLSVRGTDTNCFADLAGHGGQRAMFVTGDPTSFSGPAHQAPFLIDLIDLQQKMAML